MKLTKAVLLGTSALLALLSPAVINAAELELIYTGVFNSQNSLTSATGTGGTFMADTPFTINAWFDAGSPNLAPPSPPLPPPFAGFRAYNPTLATIVVGGTTYTMETFSQNPDAGVTVAIFDSSSFTPGRYGIGILQNPPADGAGIVADFGGASPGFTASNIGPTVFTNYHGVGYGSGICLQGQPGANCQQNAITPFVLRDEMGNVFSLTLGNYEEFNPEAENPDTSEGVPGPLNTARLVATPEPATLELAALALAVCCLFRRRRT